MTDPATRTIDALLADPAFARARDHLDADFDRFIAELITLTEIPAPPFGEARRARAYLDMLRDAGAEDVGLDAIGNVTGILRGTDNGKVIAVAAHLDTVFPAGTDVTVRRQGTRLMAPGIGDDTRGLAAILTLVRAIRAAGIRPRSTLLFVGDVGEEGRGDLRGIRHLFTQGPYRDRIAAFVSIDGPDVARIVTTAVGSLRYRVSFTGPGGHSYAGFGAVNPAYALADLLRGIAALHLPDDPKTTATPSVFGGGTSVNAIPEEVWCEVDLRSVSQTELDRIDGEFHALLDAAVAAENARASTETGRIAVSVQCIGDRPAGSTPPDTDLVRHAMAAARALGFTPSLGASSTDSNIPVSLGIPAITMGSGAGISGRVHALDEWIDVARDTSLPPLHALLASVLAASGRDMPQTP